MICGTVKRFLLFGDHDGDVFATGGEMEIVQVSETVIYYNVYSHLYEQARLRWATQAGKMALSCQLRITHCVLQESRQCSFSIYR